MRSKQAVRGGAVLSLMLAVALALSCMPCGLAPYAMAEESGEGAAMQPDKGEGLGTAPVVEGEGESDGSAKDAEGATLDGKAPADQPPARESLSGTSGEAEALVSPRAALPVASNGDYIGGQPGDPLKIVYNAGSAGSYTVKVQRDDGGVYKNQYYSGSTSTVAGGDGTSSGAVLRFACNGRTYTYATSYLYSNEMTKLNSDASLFTDGGGFTSSVGNGTITMKWMGVKVDSTDATFDLELSYSYASGAQSLTRSYRITPHGASFADVRLAYGGDAYFAGSDNGYSYALWNDAVKMMYLKGTGTDTMSLSSNSADCYYAGSYSAGKSWAQRFEGTNHATHSDGTSASMEDNGYYLQWRLGEIADGASSVTTAVEGFAGSTDTVRMFTPENNPAKADASVGQIMRFNFVVANIGTAPSTVTSFAATSSSNQGITASYAGDPSYTVEPGKSVTVPVRVIVPKGTPVQEATIGLSAAYGSSSTSISASAPLSVQEIDIALPTIANVNVDGTAGYIDFDVYDATKVTAEDPGNKAVGVTSLSGNRYRVQATAEGTYTLMATDDAGRSAFVEIDYAKAATPTHAVSYAADGATGNVPAGLAAAYEGSGVRVSGPGDLAKNGLTFHGWKYGQTVYQEGDIVSLGSTDIVFEAVWSATVTYDYTTNGGTSSTAPATAVLLEGEQVDLSYTAASPGGFDFVGWNTDADATEALESLSIAAGDVTLYAIFQAQEAVAPVVLAVTGGSAAYGYEAGSLAVSVQASADTGHVLSYQWYEQAGESPAIGDAPIAGATQALYAVAAGKDAGTYRYYCQVTATREDNQASAQVMSDTATVVVRPCANVLSISCADVVFTGTDTLDPQVTRNVANTAVTFYYKQKGAADSAYGTAAPAEVGEYTVKAVSAADNNYAETTSNTVDVKIEYLSLPGNVSPENAYSVSGTRGDGDWYTGPVSVKPAEELSGYQIASALDGSFADAIVCDQDGFDQGPDTVYLMNAQGQKTAAISVAETIDIDQAAPTAKITVGTDWWDSFLQVITFGIFHPSAQTADISAEDKTSGVAKTWYWASSGDYKTPAEVEAAASFVEGSSVNLPADSSSIVYAKISDNAGNLFYLRSDGIVIDATAPSVEIAGAPAGESRYVFTAEGNKDISVTDAHLDTVQLFTAETEAGLDAATGASQTVADGKASFVLSETRQNAWYRIVAVDKAGNETVKTIGMIAPVFDVSVSDVSFADLVYGAAQPAAQPIVIKNNGNAAIAVTGVTVDSTSFAVAGAGSDVGAGGQLDTWTVAPSEGLLPADYEATVTVTYQQVVGGVATDASVSAPVSLTVLRQTREFTVACADVVYNGVRTPEPYATSDTWGQTVSYQYKAAGASDDTYTATPPVAEGSYTVRARIAQTDTVFAAEAFADFKIYYVEGEAGVSVEVDPALPAITVTGLDTAIDPDTQNTDDSLGYTKRDAEVVAQGGAVKINLSVKQAASGEGSSSALVAGKIAEDGKALGLTCTVALSKVVTLPDGTQLDPVAVASLPQPFRISLALPSDLQGKGSYSVYRLSGQTVEALPAAANAEGELAFVDAGATLVMQVRHATTYALAFEEPSLPQPAPSEPAQLAPAGDGIAFAAVALVALMSCVLAVFALIRFGRRKDRS